MLKVTNPGAKPHVVAELVLHLMMTFWICINEKSLENMG